MAAKPAARLNDNHTCPMVTGSVPHVGGPVLAPGKPTVLIEGQPAARKDDVCVCAAGGPDAISQGSATVFIGGKAAARLGDMTNHGGVIVSGAAKTFIGDGKGAPDPLRGCLAGASSSGAATISMA